MLFFLSRELWQTVRYCARSSVAAPDIWHWALENDEEGVSLRSHNDKRRLSSVVRGAAEMARGPVLVVAASPYLSEGFKEVLLRLQQVRGEVRVSVILTTLLSPADVETCREFIRQNPLLKSRISSFVISTRYDSDHVPLDELSVAENYRAFLRLLCIGREEMANLLGLFRMPLSDDLEGIEDVPLEECSPFRETGIWAALGVKSWLPRREEIIKLTEGLLGMHVLAEEKQAISNNCTRDAEPELLIDHALYLGMPDEPLSERHFEGMVPPAPDTPFERWKIPLSVKRARKQTHHLQRRLQQDFAEYTGQLESVLDEISTRIRRQSAVCFAEAAQVYRTDLLKHADMGTVSWLVRDYYPSFGAYDEALLDDSDEEPTGWPPDESLDLFCGVYEAMDDGLDKLPTSRAWAVTVYFAIACFLAGGVLWDPQGWLPMAFGIAGLTAPLAVLVYRFFSVRSLRRQLTEISEAVFESLQESFTLEVKATIRRARIQLERDIRLDAIGLGERLQWELEEIPFVFAAPDFDFEETQKQIREYRSALIHIGNDESKVDLLPGRLDSLSKKVIDRATREEADSPEIIEETTPREMVDEWVGELVGSSILPLEKVDELYDDILRTGASWRKPALMAPLTDAELHRGFRKVAILPDTELVYQRLCEALPDASENPAVRFETWQGGVPGIAICSLLTGLPDSVLDGAAVEESDSTDFEFEHERVPNRLHG